MTPFATARRTTEAKASTRYGDQAELELIARFSQSGKPILGICRGIQVINVAFGGTLIQDLPNAVEHQHNEATGDQVHQVTAPAGSFLHELYGERFSVNSSHHQAIDRLAPGFAVAARCTDGTVEAIAWPEKAIYATQFHPERDDRRPSAPGHGRRRSDLPFFLRL